MGQKLISQAERLDRVLALKAKGIHQCDIADFTSAVRTFDEALALRSGFPEYDSEFAEVEDLRAEASRRAQAAALFRAKTSSTPAKSMML